MLARSCLVLVIAAVALGTAPVAAAGPYGEEVRVPVVCWEARTVLSVHVVWPHVGGSCNIVIPLPDPGLPGPKETVDDVVDFVRDLP